MQPDLVKTKLRAIQYYYIDGTFEFTFGGLCLLLAGFFYLQSVVADSQSGSLLNLAAGAGPYGVDLFDHYTAVMLLGIAWMFDGMPDDIAGVAVFLASRASDYVTGQVITVDGGLTLRRDRLA